MCLRSLHDSLLADVQLRRLGARSGADVHRLPVRAAADTPLTALEMDEFEAVLGLGAHPAIVALAAA